MPRYDYKCKNCNSNFFINCGINDSRDHVICPECKNTNVARIFNSAILKGKKARDYVDEEHTDKPDSENSHNHQDTHEHDHCSPDLDYL